MNRNFLMKNNLRGRFAQILTGILLAVLTVQPAAGQWSVNINSDTSPTTFAQIQQLSQQTALQTSVMVDTKEGKIQQYLEYVKEAERWMNTVNHYSNVIIGNLKRFTTLKGIMGVAEKTLGLDDDTLKALSDIGQLVRGIFQLKNQFLAMVRTRLTMLKALELRARNGIFDPTADLNDLEEYLRSSIGRSAQQVIATRERLAEFDNELERWTYDLSRLRAKKTALEKKLSELKAKLDRETSLSNQTRATGASEDGSSTTVFGTGRVSASADAINMISLEIQQIEVQILEIDKQISELVEKITERYKKYHLKFDEAKVTGEQWQKSAEAWEDFMQIKEQEIENMIDYYGTASPSGF